MRGGADKSYGIQVAKLAGVPEPVIARAKVLVEELSAADITVRAKEIAAASAGNSPAVTRPDEVMNEWAEWLAKKSFDLTATGIFSVELPAKQLGLIQACTPRSTINRLYSLRNGFWLSESPWAYVGTMHDDWPRMILTAMRQLVMENDPAAAFKTARAAQKASLCTRTFPEMTANWFYGQILYANRDVPKRVLR